MQFTHAARRRFVVLGFGLTAAGLGLAGCGTVDDALFGNQPSAPPPAAQAARATPAPDAGAPSSDTSTSPSPDTTAGTGAAPDAAAAPPPEPSADVGITLAAIEPGTETGTPVGQTVQRLRGELSSLRDKVAADVKQSATLKNATAQNVTTYQEAKSHIIIRLQLGTTKGNPELVTAWNTGQTALDTLTGNINSFAALGTDLTADAGRAHTERDTISDTFNMAGGVDEDHRQLTVLQQEASQLAGVLDGLQTDVTRNVQRQTAFVASERNSLTALQSDIKNGELYATTGTAPSQPTAAPSPTAAAGDAAKTVITIKFDHPKVDFEQNLYAALNQSLKGSPGASFRVVAVSPTGGSVAAVQKAQREAQHHAQDVLKSMTDMGVPAARVAISSSTDPEVAAPEVRVFEK